MTIILLLDSSLAKRQKEIALIKNPMISPFTLSPPIFLDPTKNYKVALNKLMTMSYSWYKFGKTYINNNNNNKPR